MIIIKPCPFCGAEGMITWIEFDGTSLWCKFCGAIGPKPNTNHEDCIEKDAREKWNRRVL